MKLCKMKLCKKWNHQYNLVMGSDVLEESREIKESKNRRIERNLEEIRDSLNVGNVSLINYALIVNNS